MKNKILAGILFTGSLLIASENLVEHQKIVQEEMVQMDKSMKIIQSGFLTKDSQKVKDGGLALIDVIENVKTPTQCNIYKDSNNLHLTKTKSKSIVKNVQKMIKSFDNGNKYKALEHYTSVTKQCMSCHAKIRKW